MDFRFDGKRAIVTGAGKGIGRAIAKALAEGGAEVHALSRTREHLESLKGEGPEIKIYQIDVTNWAKTKAVIKEIGPVDLLVNNAGTNQPTPFLDVTEEQFDLIMGVNVKAAFNVAQEVARSMVAGERGGSIVNISSQASQRAFPAHVVYSSSKAALDMMTKSMAYELGKHKIRVNAVNPTVVLTELGRRDWEQGANAAKGDALKARIPLHKFAEVQDVVNTVLYLLSDKSDMISGSTLFVDGGLMTC